MDASIPLDYRATITRTSAADLPAEIAQHNQRMQDFMPNRFLTGSAYTEAANSTGTALPAGM